MATKIVTKNSSTASAVPTASDLVQGELAVNVADKKLFTEDNSGVIIELADGVKLAGIEAGADVTDTANVTAAGALMDSELTSEASVKALNQGVATTDSPTFDDGTFTGTLSITPTSGFGNIEVGGVDGAFIDLKSPSSDDYDMRMITSGGNGGTIDVGAAGDLSFNAGGSERARLLATGQVGIGTTSPSAPLHVKSSGELARLETTSSGGNNYLAFYKPSDARKGFIGFGGGDSDNKLYINNDENADILFRPNNSEAMRILADGKVGIGTASPTEKLEVNGHIKINTGTADGGQLVLSSLGYSDWNNDNTVGAWRLYNGATERMRIDSSGNVAIGTTAPQARLHISRATDGSEASPQFRIDGAASTYTASHWLDSNAYYIGQNSTFRSLRIYSGAETSGVHLASGGTSWGTFSDERLKYDVEPVENAVESLSNLRTVKYRLKDVDSSEDKKKLGLMAQDLVGILDEVIDPVKRTGDDTEYMSVRYTELVPVLVKAIQEQQTLIESLTARIAALEE